MGFMPRFSELELLNNIFNFYAKCTYMCHSANKEKKFSLTFFHSLIDNAS